MKRFLQRLSFAVTFCSALFINLFVFNVFVHAAEVPSGEQVSKEKLNKSDQVSNSQSININSADAAKLTLLKGVGEKKALAIIEYRNENGPFKSVEELAEVKGIGEAIINANRDLISLND